MPDFLLSGVLGRLGVEATTVNAPSSGAVPEPRTPEEFTAYLQDYVPIKLARALRRKLSKNKPYWAAPELCDTPFALAVQDFHGPGVMRMVVAAATEYVFGVRHSIENGARRIEPIAEHRFGASVEPSGFFRLPNAENISAVLVNPQGTITKFNRMGYLAGFGSRRVQMVRTGVRRNENDSDGPIPKPFVQEVNRPGYKESWIEGMVLLHNPHARLPLDPALLPGAAHEFLQKDGRIMSLLPDFHPFYSQTAISLQGAGGKQDPS